ncbi:M3 family metallopeptidase [Acidobacteriota bacterium]
MKSATQLILIALFGAVFVLGLSCSSDEPYDPEYAWKHVHYLDRALAITFKENGIRQWEWFRGAELDMSPIPGGKLAFYDHQWFRQWRGQIPDAELNRKASLMYRYTLEAQLNYDALAVRDSTRVTKRINDFTPEVAGQAMKISEAKRQLHTEPDPARRKQIWEALFVDLGRSNHLDVKRLIKHRNRVARRWGHRNFYEAWMESNGFDLKQLDKLFEALDERTRTPYFERFAGGQDKAAIAPWDISYFNHEFREAIEPYLGKGKLLDRIHRTLLDMGFDDALRGITVDSEEGEGRSSHYFTFVVEIPEDIRILVTPGAGMDPYRLTFHEFGHALYYREVRQTDFIYRLPGSDAWSEGLAKTIERIPYRAGWLSRYGGVPEETAAMITAYNQGDELVKIRRFLALHEFEKRIYENPDEDYTELYRECMAEYQAMRSLPEPAWASDIHLVSQPMSNFSYIMARLIQAQIHRTMRQTFGEAFGNPQVGQFLKDKFYQPGSSRHWRELLKEATGQDLSIEPYIKDELMLH